MHVLGGRGGDYGLCLGDAMRPYYQEAGITIYHGDCRDVIDDLVVIDVDIMMADPPYGIDYQSARRIEWQRKPKIVGDDEFPAYLFGLVKPKIATFVWCRWDQLPILPKPKSFIVWDKLNHSMGDLEHEFGRRWEACAFYPGPDHSFRYRRSDILTAPRIPSESMLHPNEKPTNVIADLIDAHPGNVIIDPFMGSGTTLRAAKDLGRQAIGIEIEERYCEIAAKRLSQEVLPLTTTDKNDGQLTLYK